MAPSDSAFALLPRFVIAELQNNTEKLREIVLYHVVPGVLNEKDMRHEELLDTATPRGNRLRLNTFEFGAGEEVSFSID